MHCVVAFAFFSMPEGYLDNRPGIRADQLQSLAEVDSWQI
jgi:hypothetical protein